MPWSIKARGDEWCVVKDVDGHVEGCHASRAQALKQQAALYAQESQTAAANGAPTPIKMEVSTAVDRALVASINAMADRLLQTEEALEKMVETLGVLAENAQSERDSFREAITAAMSAPREAPVVNVSVPPQEAPVVNVAAPTPVVRVDVPTPVVNIEIPPSRRTVELERGFDGFLTKAIISEDVNG